MAGTYADYFAKQKAFNDRDEAAVDGIVKSVEGVVGDVASLNETIRKLQESQGQVTPEDQALIDEAEARGDAISTKLEGAMAALKALDESTPPAVPTPPPTA